MSYRRKLKNLKYNKYTDYIIRKKGANFLVELYITLIKLFGNGERYHGYNGSSKESEE